ncbi:MAG: S-adenosylmethionine:tRNA ribosyltransferase-isomerase [Nocardiopsaceae bacterium]|nr:S-adenosylmethionine:tRNA ribosyltransferase-isomerase [Nocardiopsaceae bacterium]
MEFMVPPALEAPAPPETRGLARDQVRLLVSRAGTGEIAHHRFGGLPDLLFPGDLLVVNNSRTLPAAVRAGAGLEIHFSTGLPTGEWLVEPRIPTGKSSIPNGSVATGDVIALPGGASLALLERYSARLWRARPSVSVIGYLLRYGHPIKYQYAEGPWEISAYQTVFGTRPGSAEMPSAARPFTADLVASLVARGVLIAPVTLHCGVSSLEADEDPYPEQYEVPPATARLIRHVRAGGGRVIAVGTTVVRALETTGGEPGAGWTSLVVTPETGVRVAGGLLTGMHEARSSHLRMLAAFHDPELLRKSYDQALARGYLWHEFGDVHLLLR